MKDYEKLFDSARCVEVSLRWYYDIGDYQFEQFKELAQDHPDLQLAINESLQMHHWYGPSYLVPIDLVDRSKETKKTLSDPELSQEAQ